MGYQGPVKVHSNGKKFAHLSYDCPFAGFIVSALPLALGVMLALKQNGYSGKGKRYLKAWKWQVRLQDNAFYLQKAVIFLCYGVIISLILVIPAARSRAAWIAGAAGCAYLVWKHPCIAGFRDKLTGIFNRMSFIHRFIRGRALPSDVWQGAEHG